jgi:hypothetical protein
MPGAGGRDFVTAPGSGARDDFVLAVRWRDGTGFAGMDVTRRAASTGDRDPLYSSDAERKTQRRHTAATSCIYGRADAHPCP